MAFRDDLTAAQARADALEKKLADAEKENAALRAQPVRATPGRGAGSTRWAGLAAVLLSVCAVGVGVAAAATQYVVLIPVALALVILAINLLLISRLVVVVGPDQIAVVSGRPHRRPDGSVVGYRVVRGGRFVKLPILEVVQYLDAGVHSLRAEVRGAYAKGGARVDLIANASVRVAGDLDRIGNAVERFLGRSSDEMVQVARETLEGHLRGVIAVLTVDELRSDVVKIVQTIHEETREDLARLGLEIDRLAVESIDLRG